MYLSQTLVSIFTAKTQSVNRTYIGSSFRGHIPENGLKYFPSPRLCPERLRITSNLLFISHRLKTGQSVSLTSRFQTASCLCDWLPDAESFLRSDCPSACQQTQRLFCKPKIITVLTRSMKSAVMHKISYHAALLRWRAVSSQPTSKPKNRNTLALHHLLHNMFAVIVGIFHTWGPHTLPRRQRTHFTYNIMIGSQHFS